jgi:hypothetical protein
MPENMMPECISGIAAILAKGFLRYRKSRRFQAVDPPQNGLASGPEPSRHVTVVNDQRTDGN